MGYQRRTGLGGIIDTLTGAAEGVNVAIDVTNDPYFGETICRVKQLAAIEKGEPVPQCVSTPLGRPGGIGMRKAIVPLRAYVYAEQHKWAYPVAIGVAIGVPMLIGYAIGKGKR